MKKLITIIFLLLIIAVNSHAQTANAGSDVTIYLTQTSTATLDGSASSASSYQWTEITINTWDYISGGTITSPTSKTTTVTNLKQGTFYFKLAATTGGTTVTDTMMVKVLYSPAPASGTLVEELPLSKVWPGINARNDTTSYFGYSGANFNMGNFGHNFVSERARLPQQYIDTLRGKFVATVEDGYAWNGNNYDRSELYIGTNFFMDTNKIYQERYQGYFPQDSFWVNDASVNWASAVTIMQIHGTDAYSPLLGFYIGYKGNIWVSVTDNTGNLMDSSTIGWYKDWVNKAHTIDVTIKESQGNNGYVRIQIDGVTKYYWVGLVGRSNAQDYFKFAGTYDYGRYIVDPANNTRHRKWRLVTTNYQVYTITDTSTTSTPVANAGADKTVYLTQGSSTTLDGSASSATSYQWSEITLNSWDYTSGATIVSPTSNTTSLTGLKQGTFYFKLAATTGGTTVNDTTVVRVLNSPEPTSGTLVEELPMNKIWPGINARNDTTNYIGYTGPNFNMGNFGHNIVSERGRLPEQYIDTLRGKFISTIEDGYAWNSSSYARSEAYIGGSFFVDTTKTYQLRYQAYFPQDSFWLDQSGVNWAAAVVFMQIHGTDSYSPPLGFNVGYKGNLFVGVNDSIGNLLDSSTLGYYADWVKKAHTIDVLFKESQGNNGFVKIRIDGVTKYYYVGPFGRKNIQDYLKFASAYDFGNRIVDINNHTRNRKWSVVTNAYRVYTITDTSYTSTPAPTVSMSGNQTLNDGSTSTSVYSTVTWAAGHGGDATTPYQWSLVSGPSSVTFSSPNSSSTTVSGLQNGTYQLKLHCLQDDGQIVDGFVNVTVSNVGGGGSGGTKIHLVVRHQKMVYN